MKQSLKSKLILGLLQNRQLFKLKLHKPPFDSSLEGIRRLRATTEDAGLKFGKLPAGLSIQPVQIGPLYAEWVKMPGNDETRVILYFHGGMYLIGSAQGHRIHVAKFVKGTAINAIVFNYGLAPENPFPKGLNDALSAYCYLLENNFKPENIVFTGDSAGGGLCLATLLAIRDKGLPMPAAAAVLSPWTDLTLSGDSYSNNEKSCLSPIGSAQSASEYYCGLNDRKNPFISPLFGELRELPPLHISVGSKEILLDDSVSFARKAIDAGVDVTLIIGEGMCHCFPAFGNLFPEAKAAHNEICLFLRKHSG
ncbi:MAG: alpha/beta hydrolase [Bacteroidetes bacterium]|nr:alpha/beta hydrolase [Bacteroidota bacterium]